MRARGVLEQLISPHYPRSNGLAENCVKIVKRLLSKTSHQSEDLYFALMAHRDTPLVPSTTPIESKAEHPFAFSGA